MICCIHKSLFFINYHIHSATNYITKVHHLYHKNKLLSIKNQSLKNKKKEWRLTDMMCNSVIFVRNKIETKLSTERIYEDVGTNHLILIYTEITY
jgi:hypothetical protein